MKINPVYLKDLKLNVRSLKFAMMIFAYDFCLGLIMISFLYAGMRRPDGLLVFNYENCNQLLAVISGVELGVIFFIVPALTTGTIAGERERQTLDLLLVSKLKPFHIICGKMSYAITTVIILMISSFPIITMITNTGSISLKVQWQILLLLLVTAIYVSSIGVFFSTIKKGTIPATVWTYGMIMAITLGTIFIYNFNSYLLEDIHFISHDRINMIYYLFLLNPIATYVYIISDTNQTIMAEWIPKYMRSNWVELSIFVQLAVSILLIGLAALKLNPIEYKYSKKILKKGKTL